MPSAGSPSEQSYKTTPDQPREPSLLSNCDRDFPSLTNNSSSPFPNPSSQASQAWSAAARTNAPGPASSGGMGLFTSRLAGHQDDGRQHHGQNDAASASAVGGRIGGNAGPSPLGGDESQDPAGNPPAIDEFPPLGGPGSNDLGQDRRMNMMQNAANNGVSGESERISTHSAGSRKSASANICHSLRRAATQPRGKLHFNECLFSGLKHVQDLLEHGGSPTANSQNTPLDSLLHDGMSSDLLSASAGNAGKNGRDPLMDKYGLPDLLRRVRSDDPNVQALAIGHDLTSIGLDLSSNE